MIFEFFVLLAAGFFGMLYGTFAGGGAFLTVPALIFLGLSPQVAVATNRLGLTFKNFGWLPVVWNRLGLGRRLTIMLIAFEAAGAFVGSSLLVSLDPSLLFNAIGIIIIIGALVTWFSSKGLEARAQKQISNADIALTSVSLFFLGIYAGFFGPGGGIIGKVILTRFLGISFIQTVAFAAYSGLAMSAVSLWVFYNAGIINYVLAVPLAIGAISGSYLASKIAVERGNVFVKNIFVALALIFGIYFVFFR